MSLLSRKRKKKVVLFLCTGDTCRGPMAQGYMKHRMKEIEMSGVEVRTAGVMTISGLIPQPEAVQVMEAAGVEVRGHRSTQLTPELIRRCDLILGMTPFHVQHAMRESEDARDKTFLLKEFAESDVKNYQISDPMGATLEVYKRVFREMKLAIDKMLDSKDFFTSIAEEEKKAAASARAAAKKAEAAAAAAAAEAEAAAAIKAAAQKSAAASQTKAKAKPKAKKAPARGRATAKASSTKAKAPAAAAKKAKPTAKKTTPAAKPAAKAKAAKPAAKKSTAAKPKAAPKKKKPATAKSK